MIIVLPRFLIGAGVVYGAFALLGPTMVFTCFAAVIAIYLTIKCIQLLVWGGSVGINAAVNADYPAIRKRFVANCVAGLLGGGLVIAPALPLLAIAIIFNGTAFGALAPLGWFLIMGIMVWKREAIHAYIWKVRQARRSR